MKRKKWTPAVWVPQCRSTGVHVLIWVNGNSHCQFCSKNRFDSTDRVKILGT